MNSGRNEVLDRAMQLHRDGRLADAASLYRAVLRSQPRDKDALSLLGSICLGQGRSDEAVALIGEAIAIDPRSAEARLNLGYALSELDRLEEALASFYEAIRLRPDLAEAHTAAAMVAGELGRHEEAAASWRRALGILPGSAELHNNLGAALSALGRLDEAAASYRQAIALQPGSAELHSNLGLALVGLEQFEEAAESFRRAVEIVPDYAEAHTNLGVALSRLGRADEAAACYRRALEIAPDYAQAHANLGAVEAKRGNFGPAIESFRRALAIDPENVEAHVGFGQALWEVQLGEQAIAHYEAALRLRPDCAEAHNYLGVALKMVGRVEDGRRSIERAIALAPRRVEFYASLAASSKRFTAGDPHLAAMEELARNPASLAGDDRMHLDFALGKALADVGRHEESFAHLLSGNALKRQKTPYDETATLALFERIRLGFTAGLMRRKAGSGHPSALPVFIIGMPRSGTTLVEQILASHSRVFGAGEILALRESVGQVLRQDTATADFPEGVSDMSGAQLRQLAENYVRRVGALAPAAARITDKLPENFLRAGLIHLALPNARIIHVRRDPVDTCLSCFSILFGGHQPETYDLAELGRYYRAYAALMEHWRCVLPPRAMLEVQYEEVVADLENQARRILEYCGLDWEPACLDFHRTERPVWTASVNQVRQPIYRSAVGRWRPYKAMLKPLLDELGIDRD